MSVHELLENIHSELVKIHESIDALKEPSKAETWANNAAAQAKLEARAQVFMGKAYEDYYDLLQEEIGNYPHPVTHKQEIAHDGRQARDYSSVQGLPVHYSRTDEPWTWNNMPGIAAQEAAYDGNSPTEAQQAAFDKAFNETAWRKLDEGHMDYYDLSQEEFDAVFFAFDVEEDIRQKTA